MSLKYVVLINNVPIPIIRDDIKNKFDSNQATLRDVKDELEYVVSNINQVLAMEGVLETVMLFVNLWDLRDYVAGLANILSYLRRGAEGDTQVTISSSDLRASLPDVIDKPIASFYEPETKNTAMGIIYVYRFNIVVTGRVGS